MTIIIYALLEPTTEEVRYIGQTRRSLTARLNQHISQRGGKTYICKWLRSLGDARPIIRELAVVTDECGNEAEIEMIAKYRAIGARLVNTTGGGRGHAGYSPSAETRAKRSASLVGRQFSPETRAKMSAARKGKPLSTETRAAMSAGQRARTTRKPFSEEARANIGAATRGRKHSEETKAKIAATSRGRMMPRKSSETRERMAEAQRGKKLSDEHRAKIATGVQAANARRAGRKLQEIT